MALVLGVSKPFVILTPFSILVLEFELETALTSLLVFSTFPTPDSGIRDQRSFGEFCLSAKGCCKADFDVDDDVDVDAGFLIKEVDKGREFFRALISKARFFFSSINCLTFSVAEDNEAGDVEDDGKVDEEDDGRVDGFEDVDGNVDGFEDIDGCKDVDGNVNGFEDIEGFGDVDGTVDGFENVDDDEDDDEDGFADAGACAWSRV